jgi:hypothetical protein
MKPKVTIFTVPFYYSKTPQLAPPLLKAYLNANQIESVYADLGIRFNIFMQNNLDGLYANLAPFLADILTGRSFQGKEALDGQDLATLQQALQLIPQFPYEFLESKLDKDVIFADRDFRKTHHAQLEDVVRFHAILDLNWSLFYESPLRICEAPGEIKKRFSSGVYHDFFQSESIRPWLERAASSDLVAISANYQTQLLAGLVLASAIKKINPNAFIVMGGTNISRCSVDPRFSKALLQEYGIDALGLYEGELTLKELAFCIARHGDLNQVPNLLFYDRKTEQIVATEIVAPPDLDDLPTPEYNRDEVELYGKICTNIFDYLRLNVLVSRGCYWSQCAFCIDRCTFNPKTDIHQTRSIDKIIGDIRTLQTKHGADYFNLITSAIPPQTAREFSLAVLEQGISAKFWTYFRCGNEKTMDREFFYILKKAGFDIIVIGAESLDDRVLSICNKGNTREDNLYTLCGFARAGIKVKFNIIYDLPPLSREGFDENIRLIKEYAKYIYDLDMAAFLLLSQTEMGKNPGNYGLNVNYGPDHQVADSGPPDFRIDDYQNPLYQEMSKEEARKTAGDLKTEMDLEMWTKDLREKITAWNFSWEESLLLMRPFLAVKYPFSYSRQGKRQEVYYVFLEGYMSWFEISESFTGLIQMMCQSVKQAMTLKDFYTAFLQGSETSESINPGGDVVIQERFRRFIGGLISNGFVKDIMNEYSFRGNAPDNASYNYFTKDNGIAEFHGPVFIPNLGLPI